MPTATRPLNTLIVGASAAGLATAASLKRQGIDAVVIEEHEHVAHAWRNHYDRLHLHTSKGFSKLPGLAFGAEVPRYPSREQVIAYLESYAAHHGITPQFGERVTRVRLAADGWVTETTRGTHQSRHVVLASGYNRVPTLPTWPGQDRFRGECFHSSQYHNGAPFAGKRVLVVGFGNSGGEIAIDLHESGAFPTLAVRSAVNVVPRDIFGIPILAVGILMSKLPMRLADWLGSFTVRRVIGDLRPLGLRRLPYGAQEQIRVHRRTPLLDIGTIALARAGKIAIRPGIERFTERGVVFTDGRAEEFDTVVLATGYRPAVRELIDAPAELGDALFDQAGVPRASGHPTALPGLWFCGFYPSPRGMLTEISAESRRIAAAIAGELVSPT
jgi:cation diffusion facilitator CzcD-associated flavoprotein CzcO